MAFASVDENIGSLLRAYFDAITTNPEILNEAASKIPEASREEMFDFLRQRNIPVVSGWPTAEAGAPVVTVQLMPSQEDEDNQTINPDSYYLEEAGYQTIWGTFFNETLRLSCYGNNQREANFLAFVVKFALLASRQSLETDYELMKQVVAVQDYEPVPSITDPTTPWFMRIVTLRYTIRDQWTLSEEPLIAAFTVNPYDNREE